jgi:hypothetical protein
MAEQIIGSSWTSYEQTVQHILQMEDMIEILSPQDRPLVGGVGGDGVPLLPSQPVLNRVWYWQEEDEPQPQGTIAEALDDSETGIDVADGTGANWRIGDYIRIDNEVVRVTDITTSGSPDVLTVARAAAGTTAASHSSGAAMRGLGTVLPEGQIGSASYLGRDSLSNYTQIFSGTVEVTETEQIIPKYGVPNELAKQTMIQMKRIQLEMENAAIYGLKWEDTGTRRRMTGGFKAFATSNINSSDTWMTLARVEARAALIHAAGGEVNGMVLMSNEANFGALNNLTDTGRVRVDEITDARRGRSKARILMTEYGDITLARNRRMISSDALLYAPGKFKRRVMRPLALAPLARTADTQKFSIVGECGFQLKAADHHASFTALDATQTLPTSGLV